MRKITYTQAIIEAQMEEMERDNNVFIIGEDVEAFGGGFGQCFGLHKKFGPDRVINMPVSESGFADFGVGAAMAGKRPIVEMMFADFSCYAFQAIVVNASKHRYMSSGMWDVPMVFRMPQGSGFGAAAQHSQCVESWFLHSPGLKMVVPSSPYDAKGLLKTAIRDNDPVVFIEHKILLGMEGEVPEEEYTIPLGKAKVVREGKDATVIATQTMVYESLKAAEELKKEGIDIEIIDPRSLVPLDKTTICNSVNKTGRAVIAHEAHVRGGFGGEISAVISEECFDALKAPIKRIGSANCPIPFGMPERFLLPTKDNIIQAVKESIK